MPDPETIKEEIKARALGAGFAPEHDLAERD